MLGSLVSSWRFGAVAALMVAVAIFGTAMPVGAQSAENGRVRVMHASPDAPAVDIFVDGQKAVTALAFPKDTGYVSLPAGSHNVKVFVSPADGKGTPVLQADLMVAKGKDYTVLAVGEVSKGTLNLLPMEDNNAAPAAGKAHVRLIHASPDAPAVDVVVDGTTTKVFSNVAYKGIGNYTPVAAGKYDLNVNVAGTSTTALPLKGVALDNGTVYTVVAVGLAGKGSLTVVPLVDAKPSPLAPKAGTGPAADGGMSMTMALLIGLGIVAISGAAAAPVAQRRRR